jgi:hypothetical protein
MPQFRRNGRSICTGTGYRRFSRIDLEARRFVRDGTDSGIYLPDSEARNQSLAPAKDRSLPASMLGEQGECIQKATRNGHRLWLASGGGCRSRQARVTG